MTQAFGYKKVDLKMKIAPSILGADYGDLNLYLQKLEPFSDMFHVDVMDGNFVPNLSIGAMVVDKIKTTIPLDCHLMINDPDKYIPDYVKAGAYSITFHAEASKHVGKTIDLIKELGCRASVAINPDTPVERIKKYLDKLDMVLVMSVHPGFGGQSFIPEVLTKIVEIRKLQPELDIQIDGGITHETAKLAKEAGANVFVAGSYILKADDPAVAAEKLRKALI